MKRYDFSKGREEVLRTLPIGTAFVHLKSILVAIIKKNIKLRDRFEVGSGAIPLISDHHPDTHLGFSSAAG